jgi:hypothetical protein
MTGQLSLPPGALTPRQFIRDINGALPFLTESELSALKVRARAWATVFYTAEVPEELEESLKQLERQHAVIG